MAENVNAYYGWRPDKPDFRDYKLAPPPVIPPERPSSVDLRPGFPDCYDQGNLGSCTANAIAALLEFDQLRQLKINSATPSRLFIYYNERVMEGSVNEDAGAEIRDGIKSVNDLGAPPECRWPYIESKFKRKPNKRAYRSARAHQSILYQRLDNAPVDDPASGIDNLRSCLASGFPFAFGFTVYSYFETKTMAKEGILHLPGPREVVVGGHAVVGVGYDDTTKMILVRNSWGEDWGIEGLFFMPYEYIVNPDLCTDFWCVKSVE